MNQAIELDTEQSSRVLRCARRASASVKVRPKAWPQEQPLQGALLPGEGQEDLKLLCALPEGVGPAALLNMYCEIELPLEDGRYQFDTHVMFATKRGADVEMTVGWPQFILVHQRRRSGRMPVASASNVQLSRDETGRLQTCGGRLYNLSRDGVAFKVGEDDACMIDVNQTWCVCFELPGQEHCYKFRGRISRKLPSSEQHAVIVGMEFSRDSANHDDIERLSDYLGQRQSTPSSTGVRQ